MNGVMGFDEILGRRVRTGNWEDQKIGTYQKIKESLIDKRWDDAAILADYFVDEAKVCYDIYRQWTRDLNTYLLDNGISNEDVTKANQHILSLLKLPDGRAFHATRLWDEFLTEVKKFSKSCFREEGSIALDRLDNLKESWRRLHDRDVDHCYGLMNEVSVRLGEYRILDMYESLLLPFFNKRYDRFDIDKYSWKESLPTLIYLTFESQRGHLSGPGREGNMEFIEEEDRYAFKFNPIGSGQRTLIGDVIEGTPSRMLPPYNWNVTREEYDWSWKTKGICYYCAHCCILLEQMPIDKFGYPIRVVDYPNYENASEKCVWYVYKDPTKVPDKYYERVGRKKPKAFGSKAHLPK